MNKSAVFYDYFFCAFQGEFAIKLEISNITRTDKGSYKLVAKNEKGEAISQVVEVSDIPEEEGEKPYIIRGLRNIVSTDLLDIN